MNMVPSLLVFALGFDMASGSGLCTQKNVVVGTGSVVPRTICTNTATVCEVYIKHQSLFGNCTAFCQSYTLPCSQRYTDAANNCVRQGAALTCTQDFSTTSDDICVCGMGTVGGKASGTERATRKFAIGLAFLIIL